MQAFLQHLAVERLVTASTQNQARSALVFLYHHIVQQPLGDLDGLGRAKQPHRLPGVLTRTEIGKLLAHMHGTHGLMASLLYGTGMRLMDGIRLRVQDSDCAYHQMVVRDGKGQKDRVVPLPQRLGEPLPRHLTTVKDLFGYGNKCLLNKDSDFDIISSQEDIIRMVHKRNEFEQVRADRATPRIHLVEELR